MAMFDAAGFSLFTLCERRDSRSTRTGSTPKPYLRTSIMTIKLAKLVKMTIIKYPIPKNTEEHLHRFVRENKFTSVHHVQHLCPHSKKFTLDSIVEVLQTSTRVVSIQWNANAMIRTRTRRAMIDQFFTSFTFVSNVALALRSDVASSCSMKS